MQGPDAVWAEVTVTPYSEKPSRWGLRKPTEIFEFTWKGLRHVAITVPGRVKPHEGYPGNDTAWDRSILQIKQAVQRVVPGAQSRFMCYSPMKDHVFEMKEEKLVEAKSSK